MKQLFWRVLHMVVIYAVIYAIIYFIERYLKKDIEELQITRREMIVACIVLIIVYGISNLSYVDANKYFQRRNCYGCFYYPYPGRLKRYGGALCISYPVKEIQLSFEKDTLQDIMDMQYKNL